MSTLTYKDAGVDFNKADTLMAGLKDKIQNTFNPFVLNRIGGFGAITEIPDGYKRPVLVSSTDGVGTKLKLAFLSGKHDTVGIDLVAMSVNDVLTLGAKPFFFLDYFACGSIEENIYKDVISGICEGCSKAGCALIGGETAEMPSFYKEGEYDLAGFAIGFVEKEKIIDGSGIKAGDMIIGLKSNGLHSNGYSLARKILLEIHNLDLDGIYEDFNNKLYEELLKPTKIYVKSVISVLDKFDIKGMAHITGSGLPGNIKRIIPDGLMAKIDLTGHKIPSIFNFIMKLGNVSIEEMYSTFNMGIGFIVIVDKSNAMPVIQMFKEQGENAFEIGSIEISSNGEKVHIDYLL
ncbi:MAG TPA: phosphoribosylformylglycinamidine cyclo-ligase [Syntrophorhabdaceae bacterium]|nr:phosphoribosylformylglycinamidine cyclo-ligase [Syntrophorhabdaceae bacterium]HOS59764.1 phosphoribosylformylglycinamidine cyclo-ligase [Syntrophorhabdaceae bacterium]HQG50914.1 phosphoribosylformylglycinamidine cyclo-ligase [Syntrophorhabdaceae bacterium]HQI56343.1 phosphoribosylformylglycinamidine cyclo-ligase [Syntrophorhabdaceae bacterium]